MNKMTMKLMSWLIVTACSLLPLSLKAQDQSVSGNLAVSGTIDMSGNGLYLGTHTGGASGWMMSFTDGTTSAVNFDATTAANLWQWQQNAGGTLALQMSLSGSNTLTLFDQSSTPAAKVTLNPLGTSTFANSITVNGTDNQMPNQTLTGANSVLTEGLADGRYLSSAPSTLAFAGCIAPGANSVAMGYGSVASGDNSLSVAYGNASGTGAVALGGNSSGNGSLTSGNSTASADFAVSMGFVNHATQHSAVALGNSNTASGEYSTSIGYNNIASGNGSTALGYANNASGDQAFAGGLFSNASGWASVALSMQATATGTFSVALGHYALASDYNTLAMGEGSQATGPFCVAIGENAHAAFYGNTALGMGATASYYFGTAIGYEVSSLGQGTTALGSYTTASGFYTTATGTSTVSSGSNSFAAGNSTRSESYDSFALGQFNIGGGNAGTWVATDPLLELGNGTDATHLSNAFTVYKNGDATHQGTVTAPSFVTTTAAGDIPMFGH